jgi:hypothetical protein
VAFAHIAAATAFSVFALGLGHLCAAVGTILAARSAVFAAVGLGGSILLSAAGSAIFAARSAVFAAVGLGVFAAATSAIFATGSALLTTRGLGRIGGSDRRGGLRPHANGKQKRNDKSLDSHDEFLNFGCVSLETFTAGLQIGQDRNRGLDPQIFFAAEDTSDGNTLISSFQQLRWTHHIQL